MGFTGLRLMVNSIIMASHSLFWAFLVMLINMYLFSIFLMLQVSNYLREKGVQASNKDELEHMFGDIFQTLYTLFAVVTGGIDWADVCDALIEIHWANGLVVIVYVFFTVFCVTN